MKQKNRHGLSRDIPEEIKRQVRQQCYFGCVCCGFALYNYEHFEPEFAEATEHRAEGITLLCGRCHPKKGYFLSRATIQKAIGNPYCKTRGFANGPYDAGESPSLTLGTITGVAMGTLVKIDDEIILGISPPEEPSGPFRINGRFYDKKGKPTLVIVDNEWQTRAENWDAEVKGAILSIRKAKSDLSIVIRSLPGTGIVVERLKMMHRGIGIEAKPNSSVIFRLPDGRVINSGTMDFKGSKIGLWLRGNSIAAGFGGSLKVENFTMRPAPCPTKRSFKFPGN